MSVLRQAVALKSANRFQGLDTEDDVQVQISKTSKGKLTSSSGTPTSRVRFADAHAGPSPSSRAESARPIKSILSKQPSERDRSSSESSAEESDMHNVPANDVKAATAGAAGASASEATSASQSSPSELLGIPALGKSATILAAQGYTMEEIETAHILLIAGGWTYDESLGLDYETALALAMMNYFRVQKEAQEAETREAIRRAEAEEAARVAAAAAAAARAVKQSPAAANKKKTATAATSAHAAKQAENPIETPDTKVVTSQTANVEAMKVSPDAETALESVQSNIASSPTHVATSSTTPSLATGDVSAADEDDEEDEDEPVVPTVAHKNIAISSGPEPVAYTSTALPPSKPIEAPQESNSTSKPEPEREPVPEQLAIQEVAVEGTNGTQSPEPEAVVLSLELEQNGSALEAVASVWSPEVNEEHRTLLSQWASRLSTLELEATIGRAKLTRCPAVLLNALLAEQKSSTQPPQLSSQQQSQLAELRVARDAVVRFMNVLQALGTSRTLDIFVIRLLGGVATRSAHLQRQIAELEKNAVKSDALTLMAYREERTQLSRTLQAVLPALIELHDRALCTPNEAGKTSYYRDLLTSLTSGEDALLDIDINSSGGLFVASLSNLLATSRSTLSSMRQIEDQLAIITAGLPADLFPGLALPISTNTQKRAGTKSPDEGKYLLDDIAVQLVSPRLVEASKQSPALAEAVKRAQATCAELACSKELATLVGASRLIQQQAHDMQFALHHTERELLEDVALLNQRVDTLSTLEQNFLSHRQAAFDTFIRSIAMHKSTGDRVRDRREQLRQRKKELERELAAINDELATLDAPIQNVSENIKLGVTTYLKVVRGIAVRCGVSDPQDDPTESEISTVTKAVVEQDTKSVADVVDGMMLAAVRAQSQALQVRKNCHTKLESALLTAYNYLKSRVSFDSVFVHTLASSSQVPVAPSAQRGAGSSQNFKRTFANAFEAHLRAAGDIAVLLMQRIQTCEMMVTQQQAFQRSQQQMVSGVLPAELEEQQNATLRHLNECIAVDQAELASLSTSVRDWVAKTSRATALDHELVVLLTQALSRVLGKDNNADQPKPATSYPFNLDAEYGVLTRFVQTLRGKTPQQAAESLATESVGLLQASASASASASGDTISNAASEKAPARSPKNAGVPRSYQPRGQLGEPAQTAAPAAVASSTQSTPSAHEDQGRPQRGRGRGPFSQGRGGSRGGAHPRGRGGRNNNE